MAIEIEIELSGHERDAFKQYLYRWWKNRKESWREHSAPDVHAWIDREVKAMQRGKRPRGYYDRMAERVDYVSPLAAEMAMGMELEKQKQLGDLEFFFGARFARLDGYGPAMALWQQAVGMIRGGKGMGEVGSWLEGHYQVVREMADREWVDVETRKRLAEEGRVKSLEEGQQRIREGR